jgi:transposase
VTAKARRGPRLPGKKRRRRLTITNTLEDFQRLVTALASCDLPVRIGFEATGNYHRALAHHLGQAGFELKLVSSISLLMPSAHARRIFL